MTEYWVSQGKKWCDMCKIFISNNPLSIRTHDLGQRHKDNVSKRLSTMRKESAAKEKEKLETAKAIEQIEAKAQRSYQKDLVSLKKTKERKPNVGACADVPDTASCSVASSDEWEYNASSGYYLNKATGFHYDPASGFYYSDSIGKWVTQEEAFASKTSKSDSCGSPCQSGVKQGAECASGASFDSQKSHRLHATSGPAPGLVVPASGKQPIGSSKSRQSFVAVTKRKREDTKPITKEEAAALDAREAARKRMEEREKPLLGLYKSY